MSRGARSGRLLASRSDTFGGRVFLAREGRRHWISCPEAALDHGLPFPDGIEWVSDETLAALRLSSTIPRRWSEDAYRDPPRTSSGAMREIAASRLRGEGIEFGAGANPFPLPLACRVRYADRWTREEYRDQYHGAGATADTVTPDLRLHIEDMDGIADESVDFVVACHVIEHTRSPLSAFREAYRALRRGGRFVLVVPDKRVTFDRDRALTPLEHVIEDYQAPSRERDWRHYLEFWTKAFPAPREQLYELVTGAVDNGADIHFHTWTFESFGELVEHSRRSISPWREVWAQPTITGVEQGIEFYFVLTK